jgi:hypothetical protein
MDRLTTVASFQLLLLGSQLSIVGERGVVTGLYIEIKASIITGGRWDGVRSRRWSEEDTGTDL